MSSPPACVLFSLLPPSGETDFRPALCSTFLPIDVENPRHLFPTAAYIDGKSGASCNLRPLNVCLCPPFSKIMLLKKSFL